MSRLTKRNSKGDAGIKGYHGLLTSCCYECTEELEDGIYLLEDALNKLAEYEDLEEQGLLLRLPCKVGDVVWFNTYKRGERMGVQSHKVEEVRVRVLIERDYAEPNTEIPDYEVGKTVFLTREEAEQKLKEMEG